MPGMRMNRRGFLAVTGAAAAGTLVPGALSGLPVPAAQAAPRAFGGHSFVTRPDLHPAMVEMLVPGDGALPGHVFLTPMPTASMNAKAPAPREPVEAGPLIVDNNGAPVWFAPTPQGQVATTLQVQRYRGEPVLTWWQGAVTVPPGYGNGEFVLANTSYETIATVRMGNDLQADLHDMIITAGDTALLMAYVTIDYDLTPVGGPADGKLIDCVVQEVDIATGEVLAEWSCAEHVDITESFLPLPEDPAAPWDYFHINSVHPDGAGAVLVSARNTHAIYRMDRGTGEVYWRLNGSSSDFGMGAGTPFVWQHDARRLPDGTISLYDNAGAGGGDRSRGVILAVDEDALTAELVRETFSPEGLLAPNMGNNHVLPEGHCVIGWGGVPFYSEFDAEDRCVMHGRFDDGVASYRAFRFAWDGAPPDTPAAAGRVAPEEVTTVFASWNGATRVVTWRVLAGPNEDELAPVQDAARNGFETRVDVQGVHRFVAVEALDADSAVLGVSPAVAVE
ncbi:hypothetical protein GIY23_11645 [Allosaccharopolyspora coralli]|uniref:ArsR family transcriptional regulator n=1 Tax=Allosaccharopolyspora coralli TaxID=2665642 RepID=A0A5Q3Q8G0_9PSEU|nr:arylsulfotransferase family protein [Allosaccharopolyspora coralli]QGK70090.1 hypothetical protein GIY23_11645 [Allosaccharopolyspora coralli]